MNIKTLTADADALAVKNWIEGGRFKLEGTKAQVRRVLALSGLDMIRDGSTTWEIRSDNGMGGMLVTDAKSDFAYFYSLKN